jgi:hypothetical protein
MKNQNAVFLDKYGANDNVLAKQMVGVLCEKIVTPTGEVLFEPVEINDTLVGGTQAMALKMLGKEHANADDKIRKIRITQFDSDPYFTQAISFPNIVAGSITNPDKVLFGFSLALDGAHTSTVKAVNRYSKGYKMESTLPLIEVPIALDNPAEYLKNYAMRCEKVIDGKRYAQYFIKKFNYVAVTSQDASGSQLTDYPELFLKDARIDVETVVELDLAVDSVDGKGFFQRTSNAMDRYFNAIILWMGNKGKVEINIAGQPQQLEEWRNIIASNRTHRRDMPLERGGKITSYTYLLYFI